MIRTISHDFNKRLSFKNFEIQQKVLRSLVCNTNLPRLVRRKLSWQLNKVCLLASVVYVKNRCVLSGRTGGVYCYFNLSRLVIKKFYKLQYLPNLSKSS